MANEIQITYASGKTLYFVVFNRTSQVWNNGTQAFETYVSANYANYAISFTEQGVSSGFYAGNFPAAITAGAYSIAGKQQLGGSALETDPTIGTENYQWNGSATFPLSDLATSGQLGQFGPIRIARGTMIRNFPIQFVSAVDHTSPLTSGIVSGQISRDGGAFGVLQSGAFSEIGLGWYSLQALTSGDTLANTIALSFSIVNVSGGRGDTRNIAIITQRTSGQS